MRICKIYDGEYPWDVRVEKFTSSLIENGFEVHLVCRNLARRPVYENLNKVHVHRISPFRNNTINYAMNFPVFFSPLWLQLIYRVVRENMAELIIVRDLPLALSAIIIGRMCRIPVVFDMAENYPAMVRDVWRNKFSVANIIVRNPIIIDIVEKVCVQRADAILAVVEESKARLVEQYHVEGSKVDIVSNTPRLSGLNQDNGMPKPTGNGKLKLIYIGGLEPGRNLDVVLRGLALVSGDIDWCLTIVGRGSGEAYFKALITQLNIQEKVHFMGWVEHSSIGGVLAMSDIGIVPHAVTEHTNTTIPNKLFDYMAYGKPVLASDTEPVKRIIQLEGCGVVFKHDSPKDFLEKLLVLTDSKVRVVLGASGRMAVERRYNWEADAKSLLKVVRTVRQNHC